MTNETTEAGSGIAGSIAAQDQVSAAAREVVNAAAGEQPLTAEGVREMMMREGGTENARAMASTLKEGETEEALRHIVPGMNKEILTQETKIFDSLKRSETLDDASKDTMINQWKQLGTTQEAAEMLIDASKLNIDEKAIMRGRVKAELQAMTNTQREDMNPDEAVRSEAEVEELRRQINDEINSSPMPDDQKAEYRGKMSEILGKLTGGETGGRLIKWGGKTLFWIGVVALLLVLAQAKAAGSLQGRRSQ